MFGLALSGGLIFLRERLDRSIKVPGVSRRLFNAPELGVIPNLGIEWHRASPSAAGSAPAEGEREP